MKQNNKIISFMLGLFIILSFLIPSKLIATEISSDSINESYVSAGNIKETIDGLGPFDANNNAGNDANNSNKIVRSFDNINYTLEYVTALKTNTPISDAYLMIEFILPLPKNVATFDMSTMTWMENPVITEENGVQILRGKRYLQNTTTSNAIPGEGTLSVGIKVQSAINGQVIQPTFNLWMEGNDTSEKISFTSERITVSAAPKYNVNISKVGCDFLGYFNPTTGQRGTMGDGTSLHGRMQAYAFTLQLYNDSASKGLKGIELPQGDISFNVTLSESFTTDSGQAITDTNWIPYLWDYKESNYNYSGKSNRNFLWNNNATASYANAVAPLNYSGGYAGCYDGGTWTMQQINNSTYNFTIKDYKFDPNFKFPTHKINEEIRNNPSYSANIGCFSAGYMQVLCRFPEQVGNTTNIYLTAEVSNFKAKSASNQNVTSETYTGDNKNVSSITLYPPGSLSKDLRLMSDSKYLSNYYYTGDAATLRNANFTQVNHIFRTSDYATKAYNYLLKFDARAISVKNSTGFSMDNTSSGKQIPSNNRTLLFGAKKDKTHWTSMEEQNLTTEDQLIYFTSLTELESQGYICVALLFEVRNVELYTASWGLISSISIPMSIKKDAEINRTYAFTSNITVWNDAISFTYKGNNAGTAPANNGIICNQNYIKTEYDANGQMKSGTHSGGCLYGQTMLVIGYKTEIAKTITDLDRNGKIKTAFDMDANERTVNYQLSPKVYTDQATQTSGKTTIYITDTLPKDLTYNIGSAYLGNIPYEPTIIKNTDGTTTLKWTLKNVTINQAVDKIKFSCTIGQAGTKNDVYNNQSITNTVIINGDDDQRTNYLSRNNMATVSFSIIKLNAVSVSKSTDTPFIHINENFNYNLNFANNAENEILDAKIYDILPFNGDNRGSNFKGNYKISSIIIDFSNAPKGFAYFQNSSYPLQYTNNTTIQTSDFNIINSFNGWINVSAPTINTTNKTVTYTTFINDVKGLLFNIPLGGFEYIDIVINLTPITAQAEGDLYINNFYEFASNQIEAVHSNYATVQVYGSLNITKIWVDDNNKYNTRPNSLAITIYQNGNVYRTLSLTPADLKNGNQWNQIAQSVPLYNNIGQKYTYTIKEDEQNINLLKYYYPVETENYDQSSLTVTNYLVGLFLPDGFFDRKFLPNNLPEYKITVTKDIVNKNNQSPTIKDFEIMKLDPQATYQFPIVLKEMERILSAGPNSMVETYGTYTGNILNGIVTNKGDIVFSNIWPGKYEISEESVEYFKFVGIEEIGEADIINNDGASLTKENGKYYIILSGVTQNNEEITVEITNKLEDFRPYEDKNIKDNLFNHN